MTVFFLLSRGQGIAWTSSNENLFRPILSVPYHNHIGDLWAIILVATIYLMSLKTRTWHFPIIVIGLIMLTVSFSRSAVLSLGAGALYIFYNSPVKAKLKKYLLVIITVCVILFIYFGLYKTTLFARPYFAEALTSLIKYPLGTGVGNFSKVSPETSLAHNIILEIGLGMGLFSIGFIVWLVRTFKQFTENNKGILYKAVFLALFVNFCFDITYVVPAVIWLWFSVLALIAI
jgi:hypothetical protein